MRISGEHIEKLQAIARQVEAKVRENPHVMNVNLDWSEPSRWCAWWSTRSARAGR